MKAAVARRTFRRSDNKQIVHCGKPFEGEDAYIDELVRNRLAHYAAAEMEAPETKADPSPAASTKSSASQAAPASAKTTSNKSAAGGSKKKATRKKSRKKSGDAA